MGNRAEKLPAAPPIKQVRSGSENRLFKKSENYYVIENEKRAEEKASSMYSTENGLWKVAILWIDLIVQSLGNLVHFYC